MSKVHCYLHIGMEKTGSTSIQTTCAENRETLLELGYLYPRSLGEAKHTNLAAYALDDDRERAMRSRALEVADKDLASFRPWLERQFVSEVEDARDIQAVICSSEHLQSNLGTLAGKHRLKALLDRSCDSYSVIVYLRRQDLVARSRYSSALKSGKVDLEAVLPPFRENRYFYDYRRWLSEYRDVFGRDSMDVRLFDEGQLPGGDVVVDFMSVIGIHDQTALRRSAPVNETLELDAQYFMSVFNRRNPPYVNGELNEMRRGIGDEIGELFPGVGRTVARSEAEAFLAHFDDINEWVRQEFFPDRAELFDMDLSGYPEEVDVRYDVERVAEIGVELLNRRQAEIERLAAQRQRGRAERILAAVRRVLG